MHFAALPKGSKNAYAYNFYVHELHRKKGFGKEAMMLAREVLKENGFVKVVLNVTANNKPAIEFYSSFGFIPTQMNMERAL